MRIISHRTRSHAARLMVSLWPVLLLLAGCGVGSGEPRSPVDLDPFKEMARAGVCADIRNRLFLIDNQWVLWDRAGKCADASYSQALYGSTPDQVLCVFHDSIAGPVKNCQEIEYRDIFDTITANLDKPDLGLGSEHTVRQVRFPVETVAVVGAALGAILLIILWRVLRARRSRGTQGLRFDGVYQSERADDYWYYVRFYPDGTVISVSSTGQPSDLQRWFTREHGGVSVGQVTLEGSHVSFSAVSSAGTVDYDGEIDGDRLRLHSYSHINGHEDTRTYVFVEW